jgi:hypothetical protein
MKMNIGMIIGVAGGAIGIIIAIVAVILSGQWDALIIIAITVGIVGTVFWRVLFRPMMINSRLSKTGISTMAKVVEVSDTGVTVNNAPQIKLLLEVSPPNGVPYLVETKQLISRLQTAIYQPGSMIPVLIDLNDRDLISINYEGTNAAGNYAGNNNGSPNSVVTGPWTGMSGSEAEKKLYDINLKNKEISSYGVKSKAIVTKYTWLGINVNGNNPAVELEVQVTPFDRPAFGAKMIGVIMDRSVPKFQAGEEIYVKYDPDNTGKVTIEHS